MKHALDSQICQIESDYSTVFFQDGYFFSFRNLRKSLFFKFIDEHNFYSI